jgi:hypothetical protein
VRNEFIVRYTTNSMKIIPGMGSDIFCETIKPMGTQRSRHVAPLSRICTSARRLCRLPCAVRLEATG